MDKSEAKEIPVQRDHRTLEQQRCDLVNNLDKKYQNKHEDVTVSETHQTKLVNADWSDEVRRWIEATNKWWSHDWNRMWRNMFSLVLQFKLRFDLRDYDPGDIHVEAAKHRLTVHAKKTVEKEGVTQTREFCRTLYLPDKVDEDMFTSHLNQDGIPTVSAPVKHTEVCTIKYDRERQLGLQPHSGTTELALKPIGKPGATVLAEGTGRDRLHVEIPVEPGFRSEDLYVSTVGKQLLVSGKRESEEEFGECGKSVHVREFHRSYPIPFSVDPLSLQAKLCDNTLVAEAPLVHEPQ